MTPNQFELERRKWHPGDIVQRFGDPVKKHEPKVILMNSVWEGIGKPDTVVVEFGWNNKKENK